MLMENDWPEEELDLTHHQLISMLNSFTQIYHKVQMAVDEGGKQVIKLVQKYESVCNDSIGQISCFFKSIPTL